MEQTKALNALEPFLALSKSASSPVAAADLVTRATSAPNTYLFAELLRAPEIQAHANASAFAPHHILLQIFSYGTYQSYQAATNLPDLNDAQTLKLRQLSLLTLARDRTNLSYDALQRAVGLSSHREVEDLVITAIYAGLLQVTLDPARQAIQVTSIAPLRDLSPGSIPDMIKALNSWSGRCTSTLNDLDAQIKRIRKAATIRERETRAADDKRDKLVAEAAWDGDKPQELPGQMRENLARRGYNKRNMIDPVRFDETMEIDDVAGAEEQKKRTSKRKM